MKTRILSIATLMLIISMLQTLMAQSYYIEDDIYYTPSDKNPVVEEARLEKEVITITATPKSDTPQDTQSNYSQDRDVDEYNRRYSYASYEAPVAEEGTQIDNTFVYTDNNVAPGDTLYIQMEDGYYLNGFNGSYSDYEYTVEIHRFYNPRYTVSISDPAYSTIYMLDSNDWNVYIDGSYAWVTPTWTNPWYWSYTWSPFSYSSWAWRSWSYYGWYSPWYDPWYYSGYPYGWYDPYYHHHHHHHYGYYDPYHHHHHHHAPDYNHNGRGPGRYNDHGRPGYYDGYQRPHNNDERYGGTYDATSKKNDRRGIVSNRGNKVVVNGDNDKKLTPNRVSDSPTSNRGNNLKVEGNRSNTTLTPSNRGTVTNNRTTVNNSRNNSNVSTSRPSSVSGNRSSNVSTPRSTSKSSSSSVSSSRSSSNSSHGSSVSPSRSSSSNRGSSTPTGGSRGGGRSGGSRR